MRGKTVLALAACLMALAQAVYSLTRGRSMTPVAAVAESGLPDAAALAEASAPAVSEAPAPPVIPASGVAAIIVDAGDGTEPLRLERVGLAWLASGGGLAGALPADSERAASLLDKLLSGERRPASPEESELTGLAAGRGIRLSLLAADGSPAAIFAVGLRPPGDYAAVFARDDMREGGMAFLLKGDVRGDLGLWRNRPGAKPDALIWLDPRLLRLSPERISAISLKNGGRRLSLKRDGDGAWRRLGGEPIEKPEEAEKLASWLSDLARIRISGVVSSLPEAAGPALNLTLETANGPYPHLTLSIFRDRDNDAWLAFKNDDAGTLFQVSSWRLAPWLRLLEDMGDNADPGEGQQ